MLTAVMRHLEAKAIDEALDLFQVLMATRLLNVAKRKTEKERLSTLPQLEKASRTLARPAKVLLQELELVEEHSADVDVAALWAAVEEVAPRGAVKFRKMAASAFASFWGTVRRVLRCPRIRHRTEGRPRRSRTGRPGSGAT
ncbi:hypothetical protein ACH5A3_43835 [Streptomyces echinatus]|uniref:hypothetical protein n=1 Tax=Streptomyces echinatus TaxID=67293 RepID=UPI003788FD19